MNREQWLAELDKLTNEVPDDISQTQRIDIRYWLGLVRKAATRDTDDVSLAWETTRIIDDHTPAEQFDA